MPKKNTPSYVMTEKEYDRLHNPNHGTYKKMQKQHKKFNDARRKREAARKPKATKQKHDGRRVYKGPKGGKFTQDKAGNRTYLGNTKPNNQNSKSKKKKSPKK